jgi:hypothetical protein
MYTDFREVAVELVDDGVVSARDMLLMALSYMSQDDVADMLDANELSPRFDDEPDVTEAEEWADFDPDC